MGVVKGKLAGTIGDIGSSVYSQSRAVWEGGVLITNNDNYALRAAGEESRRSCGR